MKKIVATAISMFVVVLFWYLLGEVFILKDNKNSLSKLECVSYAPFSKNQSPLSFVDGTAVSEDLVRNDLTLLAKSTSCIRTYSAIGLEVVPKIAREKGLKLYLGGWVSSDKTLTKKELDALIALAKENKDILKGVIVGNEVLLRGDTSEKTLVEYIKYVKNELPDIDVTYADVWEFWVKHPSIKEVVDFVTIHILPYWEDNPTSIAHSIEHLANVRGEVGALLKDKKILIGETGWPSEGRAREDAYPSRINQAVFIRDFVALAQKEGWNYNIIEAFDQPWKRVSEGAVGGFWGLFDQDRGDKNVFHGDVSNFPNYLSLALLSLTCVLLFSLLLRNKEPSSGNIAIFTLFNTIFSILFVLQMEQYGITVRTWWEGVWSFVVLSTHLLLWYLLLAYMAHGKKVEIVALSEIFAGKIKNPDALLTLLFYIFVSTVTIINLSLAFDGRYRNFEVYAFSISAISYLWFYKDEYKNLPFGRFEKMLFITLAATSLIIFVQEGYLNLFSNIWLLIASVFTLFLYIGSKEIRYKEIAETLIYMIAFFILFVFLKNNYISNSAVATACNNTPKETLCQIRSTIGLYIYLGKIGIVALFVAAVTYFAQSRYLTLFSLFVTIGAVVLNNASLGSVVFLFSLWLVLNNTIKQKKILL